MKQRVISALIGLCILAVVLVGFYNISFVLAIGALGVLAVYELLNAVKMTKYKFPCALSFLFAAAIPFLSYRLVRSHIVISLVLYIFLMLLYLLYRHQDVDAREIAFCVFVTCVVPMAFYTAVMLRDQNPRDGMFYILLALIGAWISDTGAFFAGHLFGKHKLAPAISPKKTIEGAVGGVTLCVVCFMLAGLVYTNVIPGREDVQVSYGMLALVGLLCSVVSILGDLTASVIKRQNNIKDFGTIMPGHGGILDRFDSVLFVFPFLTIVLHYLPVIV